MNAKLTFLTRMLILLFMATTLEAKPESVGPYEADGDGPRFYIDYSNFQGVDNLTYTEFYIQVSYNSLQFIKHKKQFQSGYDLEFSVLDEDNQVIESYTNSDVFDVKTFGETESTTKARVSMLAFTFEPGVYWIKAVMIDRETRHSSKLAGKFLASSFKHDDLLISDIQFSQKIELCDEKRPFIKNSRYIEPNVVRLFATGSADIFIYFEVYNLTHSSKNPNEQYTAYFSIVNRKSRELVEFKKTNKTPGLTAAHSLRLSVDQFSGGAYDLTVRVLDEATGNYAQTTKSFTVQNFPVALLDTQNTLQKN